MDYQEVPLARASGLREGEMQEVSVGETRVLLARVGGEYHAVSATCPHYGAGQQRRAQSQCGFDSARPES